MFSWYYEWHVIRWIRLFVNKTDGISKIQELFNEYFKFNIRFKNEIKSLIWKFNKFDARKIQNSEEFKVLNKRFSELVIKRQKNFC